ncbi:MAG TPA: hypothetical protein VKX17_22005 [Planctomycetota bacterium]|nr:hypothetical protein [Planctomycetota bacterium]
MLVRSLKQYLYMFMVLALAAFFVRAEELPPDPAQSLRAATLSPDDEKLVRGWFKELGDENFDVRNRAQNNLTNKGPAVLPIARDYYNDPNHDIAAGAKSLRRTILLNFDGYFPTDPALNDALAKAVDSRVEWQRNEKKEISPALTLRSVCQKNNIKAEFDASSVNTEYTFPSNENVFDFLEFNNRRAPKQTLGDLLQTLAMTCQARMIPRGDQILIASPDTIQRLSRERYTFDWSSLDFNRDEAARAEKELSPFFASAETEIHSGSNALLVIGNDDALLRAARLVALLNPKFPDSVWPASNGAADILLLERLNTPATIQVSSDNISTVAAALKKWNVLFQSAVGEAIVNRHARSEMATLSLNFSQQAVPLGLVLRWCERRAKFTNANDAAALAFDINSENQLVLQLRTSQFSATDPVCAADVSFLYKSPAEFNAETDAAARKQLLTAFESHLAFFPQLDPGRLRVFRGRLLAQGPAATMRRLLTMLADWRKTKKPPEPAAWRTELDKTLDAELDWNGQGLTGGKLLSALRKQGKVNILLEDGPNGAANFELTSADAELLPPGRHTLRSLLDSLVAKTNAQWRVDLGVIVIAPK